MYQENYSSDRCRYIRVPPSRFLVINIFRKNGRRQDQCQFFKRGCMHETKKAKSCRPNSCKNFVQKSKGRIILPA